MPTPDELKARFKEIGGKNDPFTFVGPDIKELAKILSTDEEVLHAASGMYQDRQGLIVATTKRVIFMHKGMFSLKLEDFSYDKITSVQYETGFLNAKIIVHASGNKAEIRNATNAQARSFGDWLREKISTKPATELAKTVPTSSVADQLEKLASLKDRGLLTDEEFSSEKKKLLGV